MIDQMAINEYCYFRLPEWAHKAIQPNGPMANISILNYKLKTGTKELAKLFSGFLIKDIFERFAKKLNSTLQPDRSLWIYSAHESTIIGVLNSFGLFDALSNKLPPYASSLLFELYKVDEKEHFIQLFYKQFDEENLSPLNIPGCGERCPLQKFYELYSYIIPSDFQSECRTPQ